jgi:squalene-hopene/tetraprenyl-beta-curcumene cyclase
MELSMSTSDLRRVLLLFGTVAFFLTAGRAAAGGEAAWNKAMAGKYLDEREKVWFEDFSGADRGEGMTKTSCVSCHTVVPYALARPVLRKLAGDKEPTQYEKQLLAQTRMRVENWKDLDTAPFRLLYDFNEQKKEQAWSTEAVLNSLILAFDDADRGQNEPTAVTQTAFSHLWKTQSMDGDHRGSWKWLNFKLEPWESNGGRYFGAALAAIAVGTAPRYYKQGASADLDQRLNLLRTYLRDNYARQNLHNRIWLLWASTKLGGLLQTQERKRIIDDLEGKQQPDGGWRLASLGNFVRSDDTPQEEASDGYATGLVLHVLQTAGFTTEHPKIATGLEWLRKNQKPSGAWTSVSLNKKREPESQNQAKAHSAKFMSDAATAYAILGLSHSN